MHFIARESSLGCPQGSVWIVDLSHWLTAAPHGVSGRGPAQQLLRLRIGQNLWYRQFAASCAPPASDYFLNVRG
jgi:hypothetical protein